ncbi:hypothetical protein ABGV42_00730 [Paenibacillus pabuli]|uniref:hypothetical protein n=1 Tax=Paenibacillus pabuli TaxID=1472 RepID=UPI003242E8A7
MSSYSPEFNHVVDAINDKIARYIYAASYWWAIHPNLMDTARQYQERLSEARLYLDEARLMISLLPQGDVKDYGVTHSMEELRREILVHLDRVGSLMSDHQKR